MVRAEAGGRIQMIEANARLAELVFKSINITGLLGVASVANYAISDQKGEVELQVVKHLLGSSAVADLDAVFQHQASLTSSLGFEVQDRVVVPAITLDQYAEMESLAKVDVIKIDIEGYEEKAYNGMTNIIRENRSSLRLLLEFSVGRYEDSVGFLEQIQDDFKFVYAIEHQSGRLTEVDGLDQVAELAGGNWIMLVAANEHVAPVV